MQEEGYFMTELPSNMIIQQNNNPYAANIINQSVGFNSNRVNAFGLSPGTKVQGVTSLGSYPGKQNGNSSSYMQKSFVQST